MKKRSGDEHAFSARLEHSGVYFVQIPARVSEAIGKRGNVPVVAFVNGRAEVRASLVPTGGGRHRLGLNATVRETAGIAPGDRVTVTLRVDANPTADPLPRDVALALDEAGELAAFKAMPAGKQNHILGWIEKAAKEATRARRIAKVVEYALRRREGGDPGWGR